MKTKLSITMAMVVLAVFAAYMVIGARALPPENAENTGIKTSEEITEQESIQVTEYDGCDGTGSCRASCGCGCGAEPKLCGCNGG